MDWGPMLQEIPHISDQVINCFPVQKLSLALDSGGHSGMAAGQLLRCWIFLIARDICGCHNLVLRSPSDPDLMNIYAAIQRNYLNGKKMKVHPAQRRECHPVISDQPVLRTQ